MYSDSQDDRLLWSSINLKNLYNPDLLDLDLLEAIRIANM